MKLLTKQVVHKIQQRALTEFKSKHWLEYEADQQMVVSILVAAFAILGLEFTFEERKTPQSVDDL